MSDALRNVEVPIEVVLGGARLTLTKFAGLRAGSIVELDHLAGNPVVVKASGTVVARGEVVVIEENFGIRLTSVEGDGSGGEGDDGD